MNYKELFKNARESLPESVFEKQRFEIPKVRGHIQGNMTVVSNFKQIAQSLGRPPEHLLKFVLKELAAPGGLKPKGLLIGTKVPASKINEKIKQYSHEYVLCPECGKPDTKIEKENHAAQDIR
jgi:translation initiation factor 2 subunit 2